MQFGFMSERGKIDAVFILIWLHDEYHANGIWLYMCFVDLTKAFDSAKESVEMGTEDERSTRSFG